MMNWILFVTFGMFMFNYVNAEYPGARLILTSKALDYVSSLIVPLLEKGLSELKLPDISDDVKIDVIGKIKYTVSNIRFERFSVTSSTVSSSPTGITLQLSNIDLKSKCDWKYKNKWVSDHGRVDIKIKNAATKLTVLVTKSVDGHPVIKIANCEVNLHSLSIDIHGKASFIYHPFRSKLEDSLKSTLVSQFCNNAYAIATNWNSAISSSPLSKKFNDFTITYGLLNDPVFSSNQIQFDLKGEVMTTVSDAVPLQSAELPAVESSDNMIHLLLTNRLFTTAVTAVIDSGLLLHKITPNQLPFELNTLFFKPVVPKLFKQFPDLPIVLVININKCKEVNLDSAGIQISLSGDFTLQVIQENETIDAFSVELEIHCTLTADISQSNNKPTVVLEAIDSQVTLGKLTSSIIGDFETASLEYALDGMFFLLIPLINEYGREGFAIPSIDKVNLIRPSITPRKNCIQVSMDFTYSL